MHGHSKICNFIFVADPLVSKMLPYVKFTEDKVLVFVILCKKLK